MDVNVNYASGTEVALTCDGHAYLNGQLQSVASGVSGAYAGPNGTFYDVTTSNSLWQYSPQAHPQYWYNPVSYTWNVYWTNWTLEDSNVQFG
jgi:hypothetical protein